MGKQSIYKKEKKMSDANTQLDAIKIRELVAANAVQFFFFIIELPFVVGRVPPHKVLCY